MAYIAASLERSAHIVCIVDPVSSDNDLKQTIKQIVEFKPHIVGFTATTAARFRAIAVINSIKEESNAFIVAGGCHFHPTARDVMSKVSAIDCIVKGEGEKAMIEIAQAIKKKESFSKISGIFFRENDKIIETPDRPLNDDLDSLPLPAYHLFDLKRYKSRLLGKKRIPALGVISSRGCPCRCIFCSNTALQKHKFRKRSPELFLDEVLYLQKNYGYRGFIFNDDTITMDRNHIVAICEGILKRKMNIRWDLLLLMKSAGCCYIMYGVESGSEVTLNTLKKGITVAQAVKAVEITAEVGIPFDTLFMIGFPGETIPEARKTIELINKFSSFPNGRAPFGFTCIYPGTELESLAFKEGILPKDFSWNTQYINPSYAVLGTDPSVPCWETPLLPLVDLKAMIFKSRPFSYKISRIFRSLRVFSLRNIFFAIRVGIRTLTIR